MPAKEYTCKIIGKKWLTPTVMEIRFVPSRKFSFDAGQFVSVVVPAPAGASKPLRRAYSLATSPDQGWGLCVKLVPGGPGSGYLASLKEGDTFQAYAPYGDFFYLPDTGRAACFISTGTGIAPFIAMMNSKAYRDNPPPSAINIFGARSQDEIIYPGLFKKLGVTEINCISKPGPGFKGFTGRVTDYLKSLESDWPWHETDFYLCGNGSMVAEIRKILLGRGVPEAQISKEVYFTAPDRRFATPPPMRKTG